MSTFEEGFAAAESAADSVQKTLSDVTRLARQMRKAAQDGNIAAVRKNKRATAGQRRLDSARGGERCRCLAV